MIGGMYQIYSGLVLMLVTMTIVFSPAMMKNTFIL